MGPFHYILQFNQKKFYEILFTIFSATEYWVHSKKSCKEKRGRKLFLALYANYLGPNKVDHLSESLNRTLQKLEYYGEEKNWKFEKYQAAHLDQHNISMGMEEHGYSCIDDH